MFVKRGKRLVLRDMALEDVEAWGHWMGPGHRWREFDGPYYQSEPTAAGVQEAIAKRRARLSGEHALPAVRERATGYNQSGFPVRDCYQLRRNSAQSPGVLPGRVCL